MSESDGKLTTSDETLLENARSGDQSAFAELWRRHYRSGARVARQFTSSIDADDLVSEAYTRIYQRVLAGGGPSGAFRPYLYTTIRNLASSWGAASRDVQVDDIADYEDPTTIDDPAAIALDRTLTARAFRSLPERWQSVLWYTEVEGMDPHEVAPVLGMSANGVAALSYRAREGLRKAWLQAHVSEPGASEACKWTMSRLGENARHSLTSREAEKVSAHLETCTKCAIISEEVDEVGSRLAMVLLPGILGGVIGGAILASFGHASTAAAATASTIPAVPASFAVLGGSTAVTPVVASALSLGAVTGVSALVGSIAIVATVGGGVAIGMQAKVDKADINTRVVADAPLRSSDAHGSGSATPSSPGSTTGGLLQEIPSPSPSDIPGTLTGVTGGITSTVKNTVDGVTGTVDNTVGGVTETVDGVVKGVTDKVVKPIVGTVLPGSGGSSGGGSTTPPVAADINLNLTGTGSKGAVVTAKVGGVVVATTRVKADGTFALPITGLPASTTAVTLSQRLVVLGLVVPLDLPLSLTGGAVGVVVTLLN